MVGGGVSLMVIGVAVSIISFLLNTTTSSSFFDESANRTYNIGLMQNQQHILLIGLVLFLSGMILMSAGFIKEAVEKLKEEKPVESKISELDKPNSIHPEKIGHGHI